jgi:hypothetical protein
MSHTARMFNSTINHHCQILSETAGHPDMWFDRNMLGLPDNFVQGIHDGNILNDLEFELFELNEKVQVVSANYQGCWLLVDNGYLNWSTVVPPMKITFDRRECRWSKWI